MNIVNSIKNNQDIDFTRNVCIIDLVTVKTKETATRGSTHKCVAVLDTPT